MNKDSGTAVLFGYFSPLFASVMGFMPEPQQAVTTFILSVIGALTGFFVNKLLKKLKL